MFRLNKVHKWLSICFFCIQKQNTIFLINCKYEQQKLDEEPHLYFHHTQW